MPYIVFALVSCLFLSASVLAEENHCHWDGRGMLCHHGWVWKDRHEWRQEEWKERHPYTHYYNEYPEIKR